MPDLPFSLGQPTSGPVKVLDHPYVTPLITHRTSQDAPLALGSRARASARDPFKCPSYCLAVLPSALGGPGQRAARSRTQMSPSSSSRV
jgi:hypothetical protein